MQNQFAEQWAELCKTATKPWVDIAELNIKTLNKIVKNNDVMDTITQTKKPEDYISLHAKVVNSFLVEAANYTQDVCGIWLQAASQTGKVWNDLIRETTAKTCSTVKNEARQGGDTRK